MKFIYTIILCALSAVVHGHDRDYVADNADYGWLLDVSWARGGDTLADVYIDNDYDSDYYDDIRAGSGFSMSMGRYLWLSDQAGMQFSFGYKADSVYSSGHDASFDRFTVDGLAFMDAAPFRLGLGLTYEIDPTLDMRGMHGDAEEFEDATGALAQIDTWLNQHFLLGLRYTVIDYRSRVFGDTVSGDNVSIRLTVMF